MDNNQIYSESVIQQYLNDRLPEEERAAFQARMLFDPALRAEVEAFRTANKTFAAYRVQQPNAYFNNKFVWPLLMGFFVILMLAAIYSIRTGRLTPDVQPEPATQPVQEAPQPTAPADAPPQASKDFVPPPAPVAFIKPGKAKAATKTTDDLVADKTPDAAASEDFEPNPYLEQYTTGVRSAEIICRLETPINNGTYKLNKGIVTIPFKGAVQSKNQVSLLLSIYSNKTEDFEQSRPAYTEKITVEKSGDTWRLSTSPSLNLRPGLYYFILDSDASDETMVIIGKFRVEA